MSVQKLSNPEIELLVSEYVMTGRYFSDPFPLFAEMRLHSPVHYSPTIGGWILTKHDDVDATLRDHHNFSSKGRVTYLLNQLPEPAYSSIQLLREHFSHGLAHSDDPEHRRLRSLLAQAFTPKMIESFRPKIQEVVFEYVSNFHGEVDLISELLTPLPARIVGAILGSRESDIPDLIRWAHAINGLYERGGRIGEQQALHAEKLLGQMRTFVMDLVSERRSAFTQGILQPERDILSGLVAAEVDGDKLSETELLSTMVTLFVAGHETTTHLLGNGLFAVLSRPDVYQELRSHPELVPAAVEEMARFDGSVPRSWRITNSPIVISGVEIPAGEMVLPMLAAANRDPQVFPDPDSFLISRDTKKHVAYGKGVHVCLGAPLARIEAQEILYALFKIDKEFSLSQPLTNLMWREDMALRGLIALPVNFH